MPGAIVFPGGSIDQADCSHKWKTYLHRFSGQSLEATTRTFRVPLPENRAPMFNLTRMWDVPAEIAFRICALRELFEESGILIAVRKGNIQPGLKRTGSVFSLGESEVTKWRHLIKQDDSNFLRLCQGIDVFPDIWALHEWACWLTPITGKALKKPPPKPKRFDTIFYICCVDGIPPTYQDDDEMVETKVCKILERMASCGINNGQEKKTTSAVF